MPRAKLIRWLTPQFSLRTLFVLVTVAFVVLGSAAWQFKRIQVRHDYLISHPQKPDRYPWPGVIDKPSAPWMLWIWGEQPRLFVDVESPGFWDRDRAEY